MVISREAIECDIKVEGQSVKSVNEVVYIEVKFSADGRMNGELDRRIGSAMSAFGALYIVEFLEAMNLVGRQKR